MKKNQFDALIKFLDKHLSLELDCHFITYEESLNEVLMDLTPKEHDELVSQIDNLKVVGLKESINIIKDRTVGGFSDNEIMEWMSILLPCVTKFKPLCGQYFVNFIPEQYKNIRNNEYGYFASFLNIFNRLKQNYDDEKTIKRYCQGMFISHGFIEKVIFEGNNFLKHEELKWDEINNNASIYFNEQQDCKKWLFWSISILKSEYNTLKSLYIDEINFLKQSFENTDKRLSTIYRINR